MKKAKMLMLLLPAFMLVACEEKEQKEEPVIIDNLSNVELLPGNGRFQINASSRDLTNVATISVEVSGKTYTAQLSHSTPTFSYIVEGVPAGDLSVVIKALDEKGHASEPATYTVKVFDNSIASNYTAKTISGAVFSEDEMTMTVSFGEAQNINWLEVAYKDSKDADKKELLAGGETTLVLTDWKDECTLTATSIVKPYANAIDSIRLQPASIALPKIVITPDEIVDLASTTFANPGFPSDIVGGQYSDNRGPAGLWDGQKYWSMHGYHSSDGDGVPHHISIDLGVTAKLDTVIISFRQDGGWTDWPPQKLQIWGHADLTAGQTVNDIDVADSPTRVDAEFKSESVTKGWVLMAEYNPTQDELQNACAVHVPVDNTKVIRFYRYRIVEGWKEPHVGPGMYGGATEMEFKAWKKSIKPLAAN